MAADAEFEAHMQRLHPRLASVCRRVKQRLDYTVVFSWRSAAQQQELYKAGRSQLPAGQSKHNATGPDGQPRSLAVDIRPPDFPGWGIVTDNAEDLNMRGEALFSRFAGAFLYEADRQGVAITWGGDWVNFRDVLHFEMAVA